MQFFDWNEEKNEQLINQRGVSFEDIVFQIQNDHLLDVVDNPNIEKYPNQKMYVVELDHYVYLIPFVEDKEFNFLKTIIPSRKATKIYLEDTLGESDDK